MHLLGPRVFGSQRRKAQGIGLPSKEGQSDDAISAIFLGFSILGSQIEPSICKTFIAGSIPAVASDASSGENLRNERPR